MKLQCDYNNAVEMQSVSKVYESHSRKYSALTEVSLSASRGKLLLLLGPSGSGKTTLLTIAAGFTEPTGGNVNLFGKNINEYSPKELQTLRAEKIGFVFQSFLLIDALNVYENVELVLHFSKKYKANKRNKVYEALSQVGIRHLSEKRPFELSHGEKQRTAIARAFANDADLLIADEPTASLETKQGEEIISLLHSFANEYNKSVIVASHDVRLKHSADKIYYLENGKIIKKEHLNLINRNISKEHYSI